MSSRTRKFPNQFKTHELRSKLSNYDPMSAYFFSKRDRPSELTQILTFLPNGYNSKLINVINSVDFIYSGSTSQQYLLGIIVGRLDTDRGKETYDRDLFIIAPENDSVDDYFMNQFHHLEDGSGKRVSNILNPTLFNSLIDRENHLYNTYLTGGTSYYTLEEYEKASPDFIELFKKNFKLP